MDFTWPSDSLTQAFVGFALGFHLGANLEGLGFGDLFLGDDFEVIRVEPVIHDRDAFEDDAISGKDFLQAVLASSTAWLRSSVWVNSSVDKAPRKSRVRLRATVLKTFSRSSGSLLATY